MRVYHRENNARLDELRAVRADWIENLELDVQVECWLSGNHGVVRGHFWVEPRGAVRRYPRAIGPDLVLHHGAAAWPTPEGVIRERLFHQAQPLGSYVDYYPNFPYSQVGSIDELVAYYLRDAAR